MSRINALSLALALLLLPRAGYAITAQSVNDQYPTDSAANISDYVCPAGHTCRMTFTNNASPCVPGAVPAYAGGATNYICRAAWNGSGWVEVSGSGGGTSPFVSDHVGITGGCSGTNAVAGNGNPAGVAATCSHSQPFYCSCTSGASSATCTGHSFTSADVGKDFVLGMAYGIGGSTSLVGAGGSSWSGQTLRVKVGSGSSGSTVNFGASIAGSPTTCQNTVTNAEADLGTNNSPIMQTAINAGNVTIPAGNYMFDGPGIEIPSGHTITCSAGTIIVDPREDSYDSTSGGFYASRLFYTQGSSGGGVVGPCTIIDTMVAGPQMTSNPNSNGNNMIYPASTGGSTSTSAFTTNFQVGGFSPSAPMVLMFSEADSPVEIQGASNTTVQNIIFDTGWVYGGSVIFGENNTFTNITGIDNGGPDIEPNNSSQAAVNFGNVFNHYDAVCVGDLGNCHNPPNPEQMNYSNGSNSSACTGNSSCNSGQTAENGTLVGYMVLWASESGTWSNMTLDSNSTGSPYCIAGPC